MRIVMQDTDIDTLASVASFDLALDTGDTNTASIFSVLAIKSFLPHTKSQTVLVRLPPHLVTALHLSDSYCDHLAVFKIYDPCHLNNRQGKGPLIRSPHPWRLEAEALALKNRQLGRYANNKRLNRNFVTDIDFKKTGVTGEAIWEEHFYRLSQKCYTKERKAFECLKELQGISVPRMYATGCVSLDNRAISPPFILMEYIDGISLAQLDSLQIHNIPSHLFERLYFACHRFPELGVAHNDISNTTNILFSPAQAPVRAIVIDFGHATLESEIPADAEVGWQLELIRRHDASIFFRKMERLSVVIPNSIVESQEQVLSNPSYCSLSPFRQRAAD